MKRVLFILSIGLLLFSCKSKKDASATEAENPAVEQKATDALKEEVVEAKQVDTDTPDPESKILLERARHKVSDSLVARIERTACFGRCPIYNASIYKSGLVIYIGEKWVEREGHYKAVLSKDKVKALFEEAESIGFFKMEEAYDSPYVTDLPSTIITLQKDDVLKIVANRYQGPEELHQFGLYFDELLEGLTYEPYSLD